MRWLWIILLVLISLIAGIIGGVFTNFWLFPKLAEVPIFQKYLQMDQEGHTIVKLVKKEKEIVTEDEAVFSAIDLNRPALVTIIVPPADDTRATSVKGTGFFVSADGLVVTDKRLTAGEKNIYQVIDYYNNVHEAKLVARDPLSSTALLKAEVDNFPVVSLASSADARIGQSVLVLGAKFGQADNFLSTGTVASVNRGIYLGGSTESVSRLEGVMEITALINKKNTGGPVLDYNGQVLGIAVETTGNGSLGYVIPVSTVRQLLDKYMAGRKVTRSTIGACLQTITPDIARLENLPAETGARLRSSGGTLAVTIGGPAYRAGLKENDIITKINDSEIDFQQGLQTVLQNFAPGDEIKVTYWRQGQESETMINVGESK